MIDRPILLFDGVCTLCNGAVQFVMDHDPDDRFLFASLQSTFAKEHLRRAGLAEDYLESLVLVDETGAVHTGAAAAVGVGKRLSGPWRFMATAAVIVPRYAQERIYAFVARHRYGVFGKTESCRLPTPAERARFLDADG